MSGNESHHRFRNRILRRFSQDDFRALEPFLSPVELPLRTQLEIRNKPIEFVYFLESGIASVVAGERSQNTEVGLIGREGVTGSALVLGADQSPHETFMQAAGRAYRIRAEDLRGAIATNRSIEQMLLRYSQALMVQTASTALCNARHKLEERLARWLLMAADRNGGHELNLTHEFLAVMLAVQRPGVTIGLKALVDRGLIVLARRHITIVDRKGLEQTTNGAYGVPEAEYRRLFPKSLACQAQLQPVRIKS